MDDGRARTERQELHFFYPPSLQNYLSISVFATPSLFLVCLDLSCNKKITLRPVVHIVSNYLFNWQSGHRSLAILFSNHIFHYKMLHQTDIALTKRTSKLVVHTFFSKCCDGKVPLEVGVGSNA